MRKIRILTFGIAFAVAFLLAFFISNSMNTDLGFSLRYSVAGKDYISTFDKTLTVDTVAGMKTIEFELTKEDLKRIEDKIEELGIMDEDFSNLPSSGLDIGHNGVYELKIELGDQTKYAYWTTANSSGKIGIPIDMNKVQEDKFKGEFARVNKLFALKNFIVEIIMEYEEYKALPAHTMYL